MSESVLPFTNRPYPPPSNVTAVLQRLRSRNVPERVDSEYLRDAGVPDGTNARTLFGLRFLGLLDDDIPTPALRAIATSTDEEYQSILKGLIETAYREVFEIIDPTQDPQDRIINFFRRYTPASQRERMVVFFLGLCREAGIATLDAPRQRSSGVTPKSHMAGGETTRRAARTAATRNTTRPTPQTARTDNKGPEQSIIPPALELLVRSLPPIGGSMSEGRRRQWLAMADATLAFMYPAEAERGSLPEEDETEE